MVPSLELPEYMYELRNIADNIVRERCKNSELHSEVHFTTHSEATHTEVGPSYKVAEDVEDMEAGPVQDSSSQAKDSHVGPAFHIPMTQDKSLHDLPSQLDFDWQDSATPLPMSATPAVVAAAPIHVQVDTFVEVSQIAQEAVMDATVHEIPHVTTATTTSIADAPLV
jgi:hypothetical protein